jgi:hypothetical protein
LWYDEGHWTGEVEGPAAGIIIHLTLWIRINIIHTQPVLFSGIDMQKKRGKVQSTLEFSFCFRRYLFSDENFSVIPRCLIYV